MIEKIARKFGVLGLVAMSFVSVGGQDTNAAEVQKLAPHRAVYDLKMDRVKEGGGVLDARGRIVLEIKQSCDGYVTRQRTLIEIQNQGGSGVVSDSNLSTFENFEGTSLRFTSQNTINGQQVEDTDGFASNTQDERKAVYRGEEGGEEELPEGVMFPGQHSVKVLEAAHRGLPLLSAKIFDGTGMEALQDSLTVIGKSKVEPNAPILDSKMKGMKAWNVQMSFFNLEDRGDEPDYSVHVNLYENGVGDNLFLNYQDFSLKGTLTQLELLEAPSCNN